MTRSNIGACYFAVNSLTPFRMLCIMANSVLIQYLVCHEGYFRDNIGTTRSVSSRNLLTVVVYCQGALEREEVIIPQPPRLSLGSGSIDRHGAFILDVGDYLYMWIGAAISPTFCNQVFHKPDFQSIQDGLVRI